MHSGCVMPLGEELKIFGGYRTQSESQRLTRREAVGNFSLKYGLTLTFPPRRPSGPVGRQSLPR